jgi:DNA-binding NarL/FixJ family response regulator
VSKLRILLADDHQFITEGLKNLLEPVHEVVAIVGDGQALVKKAAELEPDILVVDISMPLLNGIDAVRQIKKDGSKAKVIFLTMHPDVTYASRALEAGALGFVLKHSAPAELLEAIKKVNLGKKFISPRIAEKLEKTDHTRKDPIRKLTPRQREVLQLLAEGKSAREIAEILFVSPRTVEFHKYKIMEELSVKTSAGLIQYAIRLGIVSI